MACSDRHILIHATRSDTFCLTRCSRQKSGDKVTVTLVPEAARSTCSAPRAGLRRADSRSERSRLETKKSRQDEGEDEENKYFTFLKVQI